MRPDGSDYCSYAGHRRNTHMVSLGADLCLAFMRAESSGTRHCANRAHEAGIPTWRVRWTERYDAMLLVEQGRAPRLHP